MYASSDLQVFFCSLLPIWRLPLQLPLSLGSVASDNTEDIVIMVIIIMMFHTHRLRLTIASIIIIIIIIITSLSALQSSQTSSPHQQPRHELTHMLRRPSLIWSAVALSRPCAVIAATVGSVIMTPASRVLEVTSLAGQVRPHMCVQVM